IYTTNTVITSTGIRALFTNCTSALAVSCPSNKTVVCGSSWSFDYPSASSCCSSNTTIAITGTVTNGQCPQQITQTWLITDDCGDSNTCSQTVTVVTMPIESCATDKTVFCGTNWSFDPPTVGPCCASNTMVTILGTVTNSGTCWT